MAALMSALGFAQAGPLEVVSPVNVAAGGYTYIPFTWNGDADGFWVGTAGSTADPVMWLLDGAGTTTLAVDDDSGFGWESLISYAGSAGNYWLKIGNGAGHPAFTTNVAFLAKDILDFFDPAHGNFSNVGPATSTPPGSKVPEPGSLALAGLALGIAGIAGRRRKSS